MEIPNEMAYINVFYTDKETNHYDLMEKFEPLLLEDKKKLELTLPKKTTVSQLKLKINDKISPNLLLVRVIGKYNQLERVLKNENYDLKKFNSSKDIKGANKLKNNGEKRNNSKAKSAKKSKEKNKNKSSVNFPKVDKKLFDNTSKNK
jgi:hypothetical protein